MEASPTTPNYDAERAALCAAGISAGLADLIVEACREHDAAGRPPIVLPSTDRGVARW